MKTFIFIFVFVLFSSVFAELSCPRVYDGLTNGHFDLATQFSVSQISGNWVGLSNNEILGYEWAIISEDKVNKQNLDLNCKLSQGFIGIPDVQNWVDVKKDTSATATNLQLETQKTYYIVVRTTLSTGVHVFSMSNGIFILPQELNLEGSHKRSVEIEQEPKTIERDITQSDCPIDQANTCRRAQISVRDILNELYGTPRFVADPLFAPFVGDDDDDDDDDDGAGIFVPILVAAIIGLLLLLLCCGILAFLGLLFAKRGGGEQKFSENVISKNTDHIDSDMGSVTDHALADDTRVEFPDYDPSTRNSVV